MKRYFSAVLIPCLLLQFVGCYSFQPITIENESKLNDLVNKDIRFTLLTGEMVSSEAYHHTLITHPSEFIIGEGKRYFKSSNSFEPFAGRILLVDVDSVSFNKQQSIYTVWLKSKDRIRFSEGDYFKVSKETKFGLWYWKKGLTNKVDLNEMKSFETDKFNVVSTSLLILGSSLIITIAVLSSMFKLEGSFVGSGSY